jgi:transcriptional regulator with XRE-family HTH domain
LESSLRKYLQQEFIRRKKRNPRYSIRGFARDLEIDATALSRILAGKRVAGLKTARKLLNQLKIAPSTRETLLRSLVSPSDHSILMDDDYFTISESQIEQMNEWLYSAILELASSKDARLTSRSVATTFGLSITHIEKILGTLSDLGFLRRTEQGFRAVHRRSTTPSLKGSAARNQILSGYIDKAKDALLQHLPDSYDISGTTILVSREKLPEARRRIKEFRRSLAHFLAAEVGDDLYRINVQLFSLKVRQKT